MSKIKVAVCGANGKMGQEVVKMVLNDPELQLVAAIDVSESDLDVGYIVGKKECGIKFTQDLDKTLKDSNADVLVDFTNPACVKSNILIAVDNNVRPVVGTTGLNQEEIAEFDKLLKDKKLSGLIAPNFAIGAILMMQFSELAAKYMPAVEIIEMHHDQKIDAPSGTAIKTAELIKNVRPSHHQGLENEIQTIPGSRGGEYDGFRIHSVRLPGYVAHQKVMFGMTGQVLTIQHDSIHRESFMPGVNLAIKNIHKYQGMVYGLDKLMD